MIEIPVILVVEGKDEWEGGGQIPDYALPFEEIIARAQDELADSTRRNYEIPYIIREVRFP